MTSNPGQSTKSKLQKLISVVVITYNSSSFVEQTLDSVYRQNYENIELIISDDCSSDDTETICKKWIEHVNAYERFAEVKFVKTPTNGGICANYNNGLLHATGEWIKYIAGDDILTDNCIAKFVESTFESDEKIMICGTMPFTNSGQILPKRLLPEKWFAGNASEQEKIILKKGTIIEGPTLFLHAITLREMGGFEEKYPFIEDYPLYMKYLAAGYKIKLVKDYLIHYREYPESVSRSNVKFAISIYNAIEDYAIPAARRNKMWLYWWHEIVNKYLRHHSGSPLKGYVLAATDIIRWKNKLRIK